MPRSNLKEQGNRLFRTRKAPTKWPGLFLMLIDRPCGRWVPLMGGTPATHGVALAAAPWQRSLGSRFVRLRSRRSRPPNGCARWLPVVAIAPPWSPGGASRAGSPSTVVRRSPWVASPRRRLNRRSPARARVAWATGSLRAGKIWIPLHGIILPPAAGANRSEVALAKRGRDACCVPAQMLSPLARSGSRAPCAQAPRTPSSPSLSRAA